MKAEKTVQALVLRQTKEVSKHTNCNVLPQKNPEGVTVNYTVTPITNVPFPLLLSITIIHQGKSITFIGLQKLLQKINGSLITFAVRKLPYAPDITYLDSGKNAFIVMRHG